MFVYVDETIGGDPGDRLDAVAGYVFDADGAPLFLRRYREDVEPYIPEDKHGKRIFHASDCLEGNGPYDKLQRPIREFILHRMATVIAESVIVGSVVAVEHKQYEAGKRGRYMSYEVDGQRSHDLSPWLGSMYSECLHRCIVEINRWLTVHRPDADGLEYTIEHGPHSAEAAVLMDRIAEHDHLRKHYRWKKHSFVLKDPDTPWLFSPDFYAWEWQRYDRLIENGNPNNEKTFLQPALDTKPHLASYLMEGAINTNALINAFYGLVRPERWSS